MCTPGHALIYIDILRPTANRLRHVLGAKRPERKSSFCVLACLDIHAVILINTLKINGFSLAVIAVFQLGPVFTRGGAI